MSAPSRLIISNFATGFETDREPYIIGNDSFPFLENAYCWRGRVQKKRGTKKLGRLQRCLTNYGMLAGQSNPISFPPNTFDLFAFLLDPSTGAALNIREPNAQIIPGSVADPLVITIGTQTLTDDNTQTGTLVVAGAGTITAASINYNTRIVTVITVPVGPLPLSFTGCYYPMLPVMGIEGFENVDTSLINSPTVFLDTIYSYQFAIPSGQRFFYDTSFYKVTGLPIRWHGTDAQQFWSANFENAMFATQNVPGLNGVPIASITNMPDPTITTPVASPHLIPAGTENDWIFISGVSGLYNPASTPPNLSNVNGISVQINVPTKVFIPATNTFQTITAVITGANTIQLNGLTPIAISPGLNGFLQVLTKQYDSQDGIHWYDGDPTAAPAKRFGWVNFAPPINSTDPTQAGDFVTFMVGAKLLTSFGGAMMALGVWELSTDPTLFPLGPIFYPQRIRWCTISGTPFYSQPVPTVIMNGNAVSEIAPFALTWTSNSLRYGGFLDLITHEEIISVNSQQESLIIGMEGTQRRLAASGSNINPFIPYVTNPEYGTQATFSTVALDRGVLSVGDYGFILATAYNAERFDLKMPDQVFQFKQFITNIANGPDRVCSIRNWQEETIHFTYVDTEEGNIYPNRTVLFNYRDPSFGILKESYTTYGYFRDQIPFDWFGIDVKFGNWLTWLPNWFSFQAIPGYPDSVGGNQQGYVMSKIFNNVANDFSLAITAITPIGVNATDLTVPNHNLEVGDFIFIDNVLGSIGATINKKSVKVINTSNPNIIRIDLTTAGAYITGGEIQILDNFFIQTKEFAQMWGQAHGLRLGTQRFLLDKTPNGEFTVALFISQNFRDIANQNPWNVSTNIVRTRPDESLGIRGSMNEQEQIWHRNSNSVLGDGVQMGFYLTDAQMKAQAQDSMGNFSPSIPYEDWVLQAVVIDVYGSRILT